MYGKNNRDKIWVGGRDHVAQAGIYVGRKAGPVKDFGPLSIWFCHAGLNTGYDGILFPRSVFSRKFGGAFKETMKKKCMKKKTNKDVRA